MRKRVGCPKRTIKKQIRKYERVLESNIILINWIGYEFGQISHCPVCKYRESLSLWCRHEDTEHHDCPAIVNDTSCIYQEWYNKLEKLSLLTRNDSNIRRIRKIVKARLQYWKEVYDAR